MSDMTGKKEADSSNDKMLIVVVAVLGGLSFSILLAVTALKIASPDADVEALIGALGTCIGALSSVALSQFRKGGESDQNDDFSLIGKAATQHLIAESLRSMGVEERERS
jgi:hypothetical protein